MMVMMMMMTREVVMVVAVARRCDDADGNIDPNDHDDLVHLD